LEVLSAKKQLNGAVQENIDLRQTLGDAWKHADKYHTDLKKITRKLKNKEGQMKQLRQEKQTRKPSSISSGFSL
jgi:hypothetical protein